MGLCTLNTVNYPHVKGIALLNTHKLCDISKRNKWKAILWNIWCLFDFFLDDVVVVTHLFLFSLGSIFLKEQAPKLYATICCFIPLFFISQLYVLFPNSSLSNGYHLLFSCFAAVSSFSCVLDAWIALFLFWFLLFPNQRNMSRI